MSIAGGSAADGAAIDALERIWAGDRSGAIAAAERSSSRLGPPLAAYLRRADTASVYDEPAAFAAFIRGGGNVPLYRATSRALAECYERFDVQALADIGCGDGLALLPALAGTRRRPERVDLVEPSAALLEALLAAPDANILDELRAATWPMPVEAFLGAIEPARRWDLVESTFALHAVPTEARDAVLSRLRRHTARLVIVEFDWPDVLPGSRPHFTALAESYAHGLAEYDDDTQADADLVAQGFLMPVLVGQLSPDAPRMTWEQSASAWRAQVERAGYRDVIVRSLARYWSAPAFILTATGEPGDSTGS